jgi:hypothetical protein
MIVRSGGEREDKPPSSETHQVPSMGEILSFELQFFWHESISIAFAIDHYLSRDHEEGGEGGGTVTWLLG